MKNLFPVFLLLFPILSFGQQNYVIKGQIAKLGDPAKIYLIYKHKGVSKIDSSSLKDGNFSFSGKVDQITQGGLILDHRGVGLKNLKPTSHSEYLTLFLTEGTSLITSPDSLSKAKIRGTKINEEGQVLSNLLKPVNDKLLALNKEIGNASPEQRSSEKFKQELQAKLKHLTEERNAINQKFIKENPNSFVSLFAIQNMTTREPDASLQEPLFNSLSSSIKNSREAAEFKAKLEASKATSVGATALDFTQADPEGKPVKLSSFRGKYVLLDFWASWCGPCRKENPNVVKAYNTFKDKNFTVLGVSLDRESAKDAWLKAIEDDQLTWTHVSDLKFWKNEVAVMYGIRSIPQNFLIDPDGKIIAKNLRGEELQSFLTKLFEGK